jgi:predicted MPP superfamily phosphohydrolase
MDRERIKIMQISDVHFSPTIGVEKALKIKDIADKEKPDIY